MDSSPLPRCSCTGNGVCWEFAEAVRDKRHAGSNSAELEEQLLAQLKHWRLCPSLWGQYIHLARPDWQEVEDRYKEFIAFGGIPTSYIFNNRMLAFNGAEMYASSLQIAAEFQNRNIPMDSRDAMAAIAACSRLGDVALAELYFAEPAKFGYPDVLCCTEMLWTYRRNASLERVMRFFRQTTAALKTVDLQFCITALGACRYSMIYPDAQNKGPAENVNAPDPLEAAKEIYEFGRRVPYDDQQLFRKFNDIMLHIYWLRGKQQEAELLFNQLRKQHNAPTSIMLDDLIYQRMITGYLAQRNCDGAIELFHDALHTQPSSLATARQFAALVTRLASEQRWSEVLNEFRVALARGIQPLIETVDRCFHELAAAQHFQVAIELLYELKRYEIYADSVLIDTILDRVLANPATRKEGENEVIRLIKSGHIRASTLMILISHLLERKPSGSRLSVWDDFYSRAIQPVQLSERTTCELIQAFGWMGTAAGVHAVFDEYDCRSRTSDLSKAMKVKRLEGVVAVTQRALNGILREGGQEALEQLCDVLHRNRNMNFARCLVNAVYSVRQRVNSCDARRQIVDALSDAVRNRVQDVAAATGESVATGPRGVAEQYLKALSTLATESLLLHDAGSFDDICHKSVEPLLQIESNSLKVYFLVRFIAGNMAAARRLVSLALHHQVLALLGPLLDGSDLEAARRIRSPNDLIKDLIKLLLEPIYSVAIPQDAGRVNHAASDFFRSTLAHHLPGIQNSLAKMPNTCVNLTVDTKAMAESRYLLSISSCLALLGECGNLLSVERWPLQPLLPISQAVEIRLEFPPTGPQFKYVVHSDEMQRETCLSAVGASPSNAYHVRIDPSKDKEHTAFLVDVSVAPEELSSVPPQEEVPDGLAPLRPLLAVCLAGQRRLLEADDFGLDHAFYPDLEAAVSLDKAAALLRIEATAVWIEAFRVRTWQSVAQCLYWFTVSGVDKAIQTSIHNLKNDLVAMIKEIDEGRAALRISEVRTVSKNLHFQWQRHIRNNLYGELVRRTDLEQVLMQVSVDNNRVQRKIGGALPMALSDPILLREACRTIIDNGIRYCKVLGDSAKVVVHVAHSAERAQLTLTFTNPRVDSAELLPDSSPSANTGIGIANVKDLLQSIGAEFEEPEESMHYVCRIRVPVWIE